MQSGWSKTKRDIWRLLSNTTRMRFRRAFSHLVTHIDALQVSKGDSDVDTDEQDTASTSSPATEASQRSVRGLPAGVSCWRDTRTVQSCPHSRFCASCADAVTAVGNDCPQWRRRCCAFVRMMTDAGRVGLVVAVSWLLGSLNSVNLRRPLLWLCSSFFIRNFSFLCIHNVKKVMY